MFIQLYCLVKKQLWRSKRGVGDDGGELVKPRKAQLVTVAFPSVIAIQEVRMSWNIKLLQRRPRACKCAPCCPRSHTSAGTPPSPGVRRQRRREAGLRYQMSVSRLAVRWGLRCRKQPSASRVGRPLVKVCSFWQNDNARVIFQRGKKASGVSARRCSSHMLVPTTCPADLLLLFFCLPRCAVSKHEGSTWPVQAQQHQLWSWRGARYAQSAAYLAETRGTAPRLTKCPRWTFPALPHWACLNLTNREMGTLYIYIYANEYISSADFLVQSDLNLKLFFCCFFLLMSCRIKISWHIQFTLWRNYQKLNVLSERKDCQILYYSNLPT